MLWHGFYSNRRLLSCTIVALALMSASCKNETKTEEVPAVCGNSIVEEAETCDDGSLNSNTEPDACRESCIKSFCGDGVVDSGEECDSGPGNSNQIGSTCSLNCTQATCGNGIRELTEECDDANAEQNDGCLNTCAKATCGDGIICTEELTCALLGEGVEQCDDGNADDTDACSNACALPGCGDGVLDINNEECDDGNTENIDHCLNNCTQNVCGDGIQNTDVEACDDANTDTEACGDDETSCIVCNATCQQSSITPAFAIASGTNHSCALLGEGQIKCWGGNDYGQLGYNDRDDRGTQALHMGEHLSLVDIGAEQEVTQMALGRYFSCVLLDGQQVKCWGKNYSGQLGQSTTEILGDGCAGSSTSERDCDTVQNEMGDNLPKINLGSETLIDKISAGDTHVCALTTQGTVKCWGSNLYGQLGRGDIENIGDGCSGDEINRVCDEGAAEMGDNIVAVDFATETPVIDISCGYAHSCALFSDGTVKCWGHNSMGQLGRDDEEIIGDGCLGETSSTRNCEDETSELGAALSPIVLSEANASKALKLASGSRFNCAWLDDQSLKCWGENNFGQLGLGDDNARGDEADEMGSALGAVDLNGATLKSITLGKQHTCALTHEDKARCWGNHTYGRLGFPSDELIGDSNADMGQGLPEIWVGTGVTVQEIAAGDAHTCALLSSGQIKCWGQNNNGQLGLGDTDARGDDPNEMGNLLPSLEFQAEQSP